MSVSKAWDWSKEVPSIWLEPSEESFFVAQQWKKKNVKHILDFGCGLGRHSIYFAKQGFEVSAFDLSEYGTEHLKQWAEKERLSIKVENADMMSLPYQDHAFDALFAFHVVSHTDSDGIKKIMKEIQRVLKVGGEIFITLCSKETWSFKEGGYPRLDDNTVVKTEEGPEKGIPHFYASLDDILELFADFEIERIRHIDDCYNSGRKQNSKHYFISAQLRTK